MANLPTHEAYCTTADVNGIAHGRITAFINAAYASDPIAKHLRVHPECSHSIIIRPISTAGKEGGAVQGGPGGISGER